MIIIKNADRLIDYKKQLLLYNILEWMKTNVKKYVGIAFITKLLCFTDKFEKRVKSRLTSKTVTLYRPKAKAILQAIAARIDYLGKRQEQEDSIANCKNEPKEFIQQKRLIIKRLKEGVSKNKKL
eukprot:GHVR01189784.1.p1 GENE.GHVR01189784.1~~GHVR01189784.1.p1  ORF type:complete len:125 (-),score=9.04 GHVR01189784.1:302-676(-)